MRRTSAWWSAASGTKGVRGDPEGRCVGRVVLFHVISPLAAVWKILVRLLNYRQRLEGNTQNYVIVARRRSPAAREAVVKEPRKRAQAQGLGQPVDQGEKGEIGGVRERLDHEETGHSGEEPGRGSQEDSDQNGPPLAPVHPQAQGGAGSRMPQGVEGRWGPPRVPPG